MLKIRALLLVFITSVCICQATDLQKLVQDSQRLSQRSDRMTLVWWIPSEFWRLALQNNQSLTKEQISHIVGVFDDYSIFAVVAVDLGPLGGMTPKDPADLSAHMDFLIGSKSIQPLKEEAINADTKNFIAMLKPVIANMLGQFGKNMEFLVYPNKEKGGMMIDPRKKGQFTYIVYDEKFEWRTPLGSFLPPRIDPATNESFPGDYNFNPYTGAKLLVK